MEKDDSTFAAELTEMVAGSSYWLDAVPEDGRRELEVVRERYRQGLLGSKPWQVARMIAELGKRRGWRMPSQHPIVKWLRPS